MYAASLLVLLLLSTAFVRVAMRDALGREFDVSVRSSAALVSQFFRVEIGEYESIDGTLSHIATELVFEDRAMHIHRPDGSEFVALGNPRSRPRPALQPPVRHVHVPLADDLAPGWSIDVEASAAAIAAVEARLDRWIALGIPVVVALAALAGWWLTGRSLRPVGLMADAASRIEAGSGGRIPVSDSEDELGRLGTRFNALLERLDGALIQQRRFIADAAHELRTPLARVRSRVELAMHSAERQEGDETIVLPAVQEELVRMSRLVDELLQLARADAGRDTPAAAFSAVFLDDVVTDELRQWHAPADRASITLRCSVLQEAPTRGDPVLLGRLVGILLDNALRYGHPQGFVDVRVTSTASDAILEVEDDGIGIDPVDRERLFERFYRSPRGRAHRNDGSGLGLAIAQWIVERHDGQIELTSGPRNAGTLVTVRLPKRTS